MKDAILREDLVDGDVFRYVHNGPRSLVFVVGDDKTELPKGVGARSTRATANFSEPVILLSGPTHDRLTGRNEVAPGTPEDLADVTSQPHYDLTPEPIDVIEGWNLNYRLGNAIKYVARAGRKPLADAQGSLQCGRDTQDGSPDVANPANYPQGHLRPGSRSCAQTGGAVGGVDAAGAARDLRKAISYLERELAALEGRRAWK